MRKFFRLLVILFTLGRYGVDEIASAYAPRMRLMWVIRILFFWRSIKAPRGERLRLALEELGPIFVKFGQLLSTRRDLFSSDIADELAKLQDRVPPFETKLAIEQITAGLGKPLDDVFEQFDDAPIASASVGQVYFARLHDGREVAVKVLRPGIEKRIKRDVELMFVFANMGEKFWQDGQRMRLTDVVREFERSLHDELDLMREAANYSQLRRNFIDSDKLIVPEIYWDFCSDQAIVMERMRGISISQIEELDAAGLDRKQLAKDGVEIFLQQVFRDAFFHADMHPGNILISVEPETFGRYIALDLGIVGMLDDFDKEYLARNFVAFFRRDYKMVAKTNIESGWAPKDTSILELESAIRTCCEPVFDRPLKDFSFSLVLIRLFQTSRRFNIQIQPQLILLQKTMLNIEGLGRQLDPELDLWKTAQPFLEKWLKSQMGWQGLIEQMQRESVNYSHILPKLPGLLKDALEHVAGQQKQQPSLQSPLLKEMNRKDWFTPIAYFVTGVIVAVLLIKIVV